MSETHSTAMEALPANVLAVRAAFPGDESSSTAAACLTSSGLLCSLGQVHHEELRVVGTTLIHCDISQQKVLARYTVPAGTVVGPGGTAVFAPFDTGSASGSSKISHGGGSGGNAASAAPSTGAEAGVGGVEGLG